MLDVFRKSGGSRPRPHLGTGTLIIQGLFIGEGSFIGAGAVVVRSIPRTAQR